MPRVNIFFTVICSSLFWLGAGLFSVLIYHIVLRLWVYFSLDFTHDLGPSLDLVT